MATPEQNLPGDELPDNRSGESSAEDRRNPSPNDHRSMGTHYLGSSRSRNSNNNPNPNWYEPLDNHRGRLPRGNYQTSQNRHGRDYEDLPPEELKGHDADELHDEIADNFDNWKDFQVTDRGALAAKELEGLTDEEKIQRANTILEYNRRRQQNNRYNETSFRHEKAKGWFALQMFIAYGLSSLFMIFIVVFTGLFIYTTFKDGTLNDNGIGVGILNTIQEVLRIIFSPGPGDAF